MKPIDALMNETIFLGGIPVTRATAARILKEDGLEDKVVDYFAFAPKFKAPDFVSPWTYEQYREATVDLVHDGQAWREAQ